MDVLERLLYDLQSSVDQSDSVLEPISIVNNIAAHAFSDELGAVDQEYVSHLLLQSENPPSLLAFLRDSPHTKVNKDTVKAKTAALKFLSKYVKFTESIEQFAVLAFSAFFSCYNAEESNEVKTASLLPLKNIFRRCGQFQNDSGSSSTADATDSAEDLSNVLLPEKINLVGVFELFFNELRTNKKITKGMKCELLKLIGIIVRAYPDHEHVKKRVKALIDLCLFELKRNFTSGSNEPDLPTISGAFSCLDRCMFFPESRIILNNNAELWEYLLKAISAVSSGDLTRFAVSCKALRLIKHHTDMFRSLLTKKTNASLTYKAVKQCHQTGKAAIVKHSEDAMYSVLTQITLAAVENTASKDAKNVLQELFDHSLNVLTTAGAAEKEIIIAVKGISAVASCITLLDLSSSKKILQKIEKNNVTNVRKTSDDNFSAILGVVHALISAAEQDYEDVNDENEESGDGVLRLGTGAAGRTSLFLNSVASILFAVRGSFTASPAILSFLEKSSVDVIVGYSRFHQKQQIIVQRALCLILYSLDNSKYGINDSSGDNVLNSIKSDSLSATSSMLVEYLDEIIPALLLRTISRTASGENVILNQSLLQLLTEGTGSTGSGYGFDALLDRLVPAYFPLWCEMMSPENPDIVEKLKSEREGGRGGGAMARNMMILIYDKMMEEILKYLRGLDLSYLSSKTMNSNAINTNNETDVSQSQDILGADSGIINENGNQGQTENEDSMSACNIADQDLLLNLVLFLEIFISSHSFSRLLVWFKLLILEVVQLIRKYPMVSSLYRLLLCIMRATDALPSFSTSLSLHSASNSNTNNTSTSTSISTSSSSSVSNTISCHGILQRQDDLNLFESVLSVRSLLYDVRTCHLPHFHDELLSKALETILSASSYYIHLKTLLSAILLSFQSGVQVLSGVLALQKIIYQYTEKNEDQDLIDYHLSILLPLLNTYLMVAGGGKKGGGGQISLQGKGTGVATVQMKKAKQLLRKRTDSPLKLQLQLHNENNNDKNNNDGIANIRNEEFQIFDDDRIKGQDLQRSIIRLLGSLGGRNQNLLLDATQEVQSSVSWGGSNCLTIDMPLMTTTSSSSSSSSSSSNSHSRIKNLPLSLDKLLPRVVELCSAQDQSTGTGTSLGSSGDRQARIAAAELLHGIITYMVGAAASAPKIRTGESQYAAMYSLVLPAALGLSVCGDVVCRQLFHTLLFQVIRWFSGVDNVHASESSALLDSLMAGLSNPSDSTLRNQCSDGLAEYFKWTVKQTSKKELAANNACSDLILRLLVLVTHPNEVKRLGAASTLSKICKVFREETSLIHRFALQIVYTLLKGLRSGGTDGTLQELVLASQRYEEVIVRTKQSDEDSSLDKRDEGRTFPQCLQDLVEWLWTGCGSSNMHYRRSCMGTFTSLCPFLSFYTVLHTGLESGSRSQSQTQIRVKTYVNNLINEKGISDIVRVMEGDKDRVKITDISAVSTDLESVKIRDNSDSNAESSDLPLSDELKFLERLSAMTDAYHWLLKSGYVTPSQLFLSDLQLQVEVEVEVDVGVEVVVKKEKGTKRKAKVLEESESIGSLSSSTTPPVQKNDQLILRSIRKFIQSCSHLGQSDNMRLSDGSNEAMGKARTTVLESRAEVLRRVLQLMHILLTPSQGSGQGSGQGSVGDDQDTQRIAALLRAEGVLTADFYNLIFQTLLHPSEHGMFPGTLSSEQVGVLLPAAAQQLFSLHSYFQIDIKSSTNLENSDSRGSNVFVSCLTDHMHRAVTKLERLGTSIEEINCFLRVHRLLLLSDATLLHSAYSSTPSNTTSSSSSSSTSSSTSSTSLQLQIHEVAYTLINSVAKLSGNATPEMTDLTVLVAQAGLELGLPLIDPSFYTVASDSDEGGKGGGTEDRRMEMQIENNVKIKREKGDEGGKEGSNEKWDVLEQSLNSKTLLCILLTPITVPSSSSTLALSGVSVKIEAGMGAGTRTGTGLGAGKGPETGAGEGLGTWVGTGRGQVQGLILMERFSSQLISYIIGDNGDSFKKHGRGFVDCLLKTVNNLNSVNTENKSETVLFSGFTVLMRLSRGVISAVLTDLKGIKSVPAAVACDVITYFLPLFLPQGDSMRIGLQGMNDDESDETLLDLLEIDSLLPSMSNKILRSSAVTHCFKSLKYPSQVSLPCLTIALRALPYLLTGYSATSPRTYLRYTEEQETVDECVEALEEFVASRFPVISSQLDPSSSNGKEFRSLLRTYLDSLVHGGSLSLLGPLLPAFREGPSHRYYTWLIDALKDLAVSISLSQSDYTTISLRSGYENQSTGVQKVCGYCLIIASDEGEDLAVKKTFFDSFCVPILSSCSPKLLADFLSGSWSNLKVGPLGTDVSVAKKMNEIIQKEMKIGDSIFATDTLLFLQSCCFKMFEISYDRLSLGTLKGCVADSFLALQVKTLPPSLPQSQSQSLSQSQFHSQIQIKSETASKSKGNELTSSLSKISYKLLRTVLPTTANNEVKQRLYSIAFNCLTIIVAKTQCEEKFYDMFLFKEKNGECVWNKLVDCTITYEFQSDTEKFETSYLGCLGGLLGGGRDNKGGKMRSGMSRERGRSRGVRTGLGTGSYISQYLSGSILESSSIMTQGPNPFGSQALGGKRNGFYSQTQSQSQSQRQNLGPGSTQSDYMDLGIFPTSTSTPTSSMSQSQSQYNSNNGNDGMNNSENDVVCGLDDQIIALELNDLNTQTCMGSIVRVIQRMNTLFGHIDTSNSGGSSSSSSSAASSKTGKWRNDIMPNWIMEIRDRLSTYTPGSRNVRLFMLRLLLNQPVTNIVIPWVLDLIPCVLECSLRDLCGGEVNTGYHYFLRDVVFTLCDSWARAISPPDSTQAPKGQGLDKDIIVQISKLISYLIKHSYCETADVVKENIKSIGALYRLFKGSKGSTGFTVSLGPVMVLLTVEAGPTGGANATAKSKGSEGVRKRLAGLLLLQTLLEAEYPILNMADASYTLDPELNFEEEPSLENILNAVLQCVKFPRKEIAEKSSCVLGLILRQIRIRENDKKRSRLPLYCLGLSDVLSNKLESKFVQKDGIDSIASCVCAISLPYPQFLKRSLFLKIMSAFRKLKPRSRYEFLQATHVSTEIFPTSTSTSTSSTSLSSGDGSVINYLKPFISTLLTDLSTVVIRYNNNPVTVNSTENSNDKNESEESENNNENKSVLPRIRLPMVQLLTVKLLVRYSSTLDLELLEQLVQDLSGEDTGKGNTGDTGHGLAMVLDEKSVLQVREASYDLLIALCKDHPIVGMTETALNVTKNKHSNNDQNKERTYAAKRVRTQLCSLLLRGFTDPDDEGMDTDIERSTDMSTDMDSNDNLDNYNFSPDDDDDEGAPSGIDGIEVKGRVGIRRRVFDFFNVHFGLGGDPYVRLNLLMTQLFEASRTDCWLHYTSYLLLGLAKQNKAEYLKPIFPHQLAADSTFTPMQLSVNRQGSKYSQGQSTGSFDAFSLPLFSLERTQSSQSQVQWDNKTGVYGTQSTDLGPRKSGFIRGTQEVSWLNTQQYSKQSRTMATRTPQFQFRNPLSTQALFSHGTSHSSGTQGGPGSAGGGGGGTQARAGTGAGTGTGTGSGSQMMIMGPPTHLPAYLNLYNRELSSVSQRVPRRFKRKIYDPSSQSYTSSSSSSSSSSNPYSKRGSGSNSGTTSFSTSSASSSASSSAAMYALTAARVAKKAMEDRTKRTAKVVIYRNYKEGELIDICIPLCDILKPLQGLCLRDSRSASTLFSILFHTLYTTVTLDSLEATTMRTNLKSLLYHANSQNTHFISSMLTSCTNCLGMEDPRSPKNKGGKPWGKELFSFSSVEEITEISLQSLNFHSGIQYLESLLLISKRIELCPNQDVTLVKKKGRKSITLLENDIENENDNNNNNNNNIDLSMNLNNVPRDERTIWLQLSRLYSALGENDVLLGLAERIGSYPRQTRRAIDAEVSGDYRKAVQLYGDLFDLTRKSNKAVDKKGKNNRNSSGSVYDSDEESVGTENTEKTNESDDESDKMPTPDEIELWRHRSMDSLKQLCDWDQLHNNVEILMQNHIEEEDDDNGNLITDIASLMSRKHLSKNLNHQQNQLLPSYITSLVHTGMKRKDEFIRFIDSALYGNAGGSMRTSIESSYPADVATCYALKGDWSRVKMYTEMAFIQFGDRWRSLHPCATGARRGLLRGLQRIVELDDAAHYKTSSSYSSPSLSSSSSSSSFSDNNNDDDDNNSSTQSISNNNDNINNNSNKIGNVSTAINKMLRTWKHTTPHTSDPIWLWDEITCVRRIALRNDKEHSSEDSSEPSSEPEFCADVASHLSNMHISTASAAVRQNIMQAVQPQLLASNMLKRLLQEKKEKLSLDEVKIVCAWNNKSIASKNVPDANKSYRTTLDLLERSTEGGILDRIPLLLMKAEWLAKWADHDRTHTQAQQISSEGSGFNEKYTQALDTYREAAVLTDQPLRIDNKWVAVSISLRTQAYGKLAQHCEQQLRALEAAHSDSEGMNGVKESESEKGKGKGKEKEKKGGEKVTKEERKEERKEGNNGQSSSSQTTSAINALALQTVEAFVKGLHLENSYCRDRLIRLTYLTGKYPHTANTLLSNLHTIPSWTFLKYAPQLMGTLDQPEGIVSAAILERVARMYPRAINYPYYITSEFLSPKGIALCQGSDTGGGLTSLLKDDALEMFVQSLGGLAHPELRWNDGMKIISKIFTKDLPKAKLLYQKLCDDVLTTSWSKVGSKIGTYNQNRAKKWKPLMSSLTGTQSSNLITSESFKKLVKEGMVDRTTMRFDSGKVPLREFSNWLADFDPATFKIEIPGQYAQAMNRAPVVGNHAMIVGVDPQLLVMSSIRKPKRIKFYGSDGRERMFLVKCGEDLRNDERIELLFDIMNSVIASSTSSSTTDSPTVPDNMEPDQSPFEEASRRSKRTNLQARTYTVIPMTSEVGIMEWVGDTVTIKAIVTEEMTLDSGFCHQNPEFIQNDTKDITRLSASQIRYDWIQGHEAPKYHKMFKEKNEKSGRSTQKKISELIPEDFIRRRLLKIAVGPEAFITLRAEYVKTLAVSSLFGYILGLGDRHLENLLVDVKTGAIVQIDFGICFGKGQWGLPVPEFIPFRLSPQMTGVLQPLDGCVLLRHYMVAAMTSLRDDSGFQIVSNALQVYINDPLLDWIGEMEERGDDGESRNRVERCLKKLKGVNPGVIMAEELGLNSWIKREKSLSALTAMIQSTCARGVSAGRNTTTSDTTSSSSSSSAMTVENTSSQGNNRNNDVTDSNYTDVLEAEEQIDALIALATDPNIIVRQWVGLATWI